MKDLRFWKSTPTLLYVMIGAAVLLNLSALFLTILGPDGALYASIAKNMVVRNDFVQMFGDGKEWLDKPHFPFWVSALFFRCFGFATWAYKLPAILFLLGGAAYTYQFAKRLYGRETALWSVLILLTAEHIVLSNNDVRAEPYLTALIIGAVYHFYRCLGTRSFMHLLLGSLLTACALMTKGMMALVPVGGAIAGELIAKKRWKELFHVRWLVAGVLVLLFIAPEVYSLWVQFDLHPEKVVFGRTGVSGIRFFFWDSQFGRFFNTGPIKGKGDPSFFLHTLLWAFLPWSIVLYAAVFQFFRKNFRASAKQEWFCITGAGLTFLLFSASRFQLPHYLNIVFPFFAILTANYLLTLQNSASVRRVQGVQTAVMALLLVAELCLEFGFQLYESPSAGVLSTLLIFIAVQAVNSYFKREELRRTLLRTAAVAILVNLYLNLAFYPALLQYQSGSEAAFWINRHNTSRLPVAQQVYQQYAFALEFYLHQPLYTIDTVHNRYPPAPFLLYVHGPDKELLARKGWQMETLQTFEHYPISKLKGAFLNYNTRSSTLTTYEVVRVNKY